MDKTLILVTTKGCEACNIMKKLVNKAFTHDIIQARSIDYKIEDVENTNYKNLKDFPTLLFIKDDNIVHKFEGTTSVPHIIEMLCTYL